MNSKPTHLINRIEVGGSHRNSKMTALNPTDNNVLLILGEVRGDVKGIARALSSHEAKINNVEAASEARFAELEARISNLESIRTRVGAMAVGVGLTSAIAANKLPAIIQFILGG